MIEHLQHDFKYMRARRQNGGQVLQITAMSEDATFTSYSFNPDSNSIIHGEKGGIGYQTNEVAMKYTNLDKSNRKHEKSKIKRTSTRRRAESMRNFPSSDMESDTGSDGLAVNSEGSGRSGDWGPPQLRRKPKAHRKRPPEVRMSYTDSGISLSKTDLESLSGISVNTHYTPDYRHLSRTGLIMHTTESKTSTVDSLLEQKSTTKGPPNFHSLSPIPNRLSVNGMNGSEYTHKVQGEPVQPSVREIEEKEKRILQQCLKNEKLVHPENTSKNAANGDDDISRRESRFPLPDHLNYPICRYRTKSESDNRLHPLKKLRDGWRKLRARKLFNDKMHSADTDCYPEFYPAYVPAGDKDEDDNAMILSRLSRNPNERKNFAKRIFGRLGSKSYSVSNGKLDENVRGRPRISRSASTLSVPDALQDMWKKVHTDVPCEQKSNKSLHKVSSMPSIHTNSQRENKENYFTQLSSSSSNSEKETTGNGNRGNELLDNLSGLHITQEKCNTDKKVCFNDNTTHYYDDFKLSRNENVPPEAANSLVRSSSCHELYNRNNRNQKGNNYVVPQQMYYSPAAPCACCIPGQPVQYMPFYPYPNYVYPVPSYGGYPPMEFVPNFYPVPNYYPRNGEHGFPMMNGVSAVPVDNVVAPLDVKVEHEKMAEKRKISEINFDTFV